MSKRISAPRHRRPWLAAASADARRQARRASARRGARSRSGRTRTARRPSRRSSPSGPRRKGLTVEVVEKDFGKIRDDLKTVQPESAPDVIIGAHDWTGQLAADGLVAAALPDARRRGRSSRRTRSARSRTAPRSSASTAPRSCSRTSASSSTRSSPRCRRPSRSSRPPALAFKKKASGNLAVAVPQGAAGDAYHMYPFFSGLGGYVFGVNKAGNLDAVRHRPREHDVPVERGADRHVEQDRASSTRRSTTASRRTRS